MIFQSSRVKVEVDFEGSDGDRERCNRCTRLRKARVREDSGKKGVGEF